MAFLPRRPFYRHLPHVRVPGFTHAVTFRLADSLPAHVVTRLKAEETGGAARLRTRVAHALDQGYGSCALRDERIAALVETALLCFDDARYRLFAWVVMPNHVHVLVAPHEGHPLDTIVHGWKSFTAKRANALLGQSGRFWQPDYFDRYLRGEEHFDAAVTYVEENPVKAGLCARPEEWRFGSAWRRAKREADGARASRPPP